MLNGIRLSFCLELDLLLLMHSVPKYIVNSICIHAHMRKTVNNIFKLRGGTNFRQIRPSRFVYTKTIRFLSDGSLIYMRLHAQPSIQATKDLAKDSHTHSLFHNNWYLLKPSPTRSVTVQILPETCNVWSSIYLAIFNRLTGL
jgi:hypothetical protein